MVNYMFDAFMKKNPLVLLPSIKKWKKEKLEVLDVQFYQDQIVFHWQRHFRESHSEIVSPTAV